MDMTLEQQAGQRLMVGFDGVSLDAGLTFLIRDLKVGGLILFARNIETPGQVAALCRDAQACAASCGQPPLFIAIDQEGGQVARLREPHFTGFPEGVPGMKQKHDVDRFTEITTRELKNIGVNMNMAPVMDVEPDGFEGIMHKRVFLGDAGFVASMGTRMIRGFQCHGIMAVAKHFPGIGRTTLDSHLTLPELETPAAELEDHDFIPFHAAIRDHVAGVMLSHIKYLDLDPDWPASLSRRIVKELLRERMGYDGLVMTDDLDMKAISVPIETSVQRVIHADVDLVLICHAGPNHEKAFKTLVHEIRTRKEAGENSTRSLKRIMNLKQTYFGSTL